MKPAYCDHFAQAGLTRVGECGIDREIWSYKGALDTCIQVYIGILVSGVHACVRWSTQYSNTNPPPVENCLVMKLQPVSTTDYLPTTQNTSVTLAVYL